MSYRNPQIIVDRSAEIWAQGIAKVGDTIGAGITNYFKAKALAKQKKDKIDNANNKLLIQTQIKYDKDIVDQVGKVKNNVFKDLVDKNITAFGNKAMESNARLAMSGLSLNKDQAKQERDNVRNYNQYSTNTIAQVNNVSENADSILQNTTDVIVSQYEPAYGDDLSNLVAVNVVNGNSIPGVTTNVAIEPTEDNSNILRINSRLKVDSDIYRSYKAAGIIDDELYPPTDGYIDIKFERNLSEWDGTFFDKIIDAPDSDKAFIEGGIRDKKGNIDPRYILKNMATTTILNRDGSSTKYREQILDINAIENAQAYNSIVTSQAVGLGSYDIKQRKQYITGALNWTSDAADAYASKNPDEQQAFFEGQLKMENLSLLAKPRKVTQEDVDNKIIPGLTLLDDNNQPNFIYTIPYGNPVTVEAPDKEEEEEDSNFKVDAAERAVNDLLEDPISYLTNIGGPDASGVADRSYDEETKILEFSMTDKGTGNKKMKKFDLSDKSQVKNLARTLFNFRGNKSLEVSENIDSVVDKIFDFSETGDLPIF